MDFQALRIFDDAADVVGYRNMSFTCSGSRAGGGQVLPVQR
jgi:hypothetical protein